MKKREVYHVIPYAKDGWQIRNERTDEIISVYDTKQEAVNKAIQNSKDNTPSRLVVHKENSRIQVLYTYG
ncbi:DUF2188 domain-containing protein [Candidatus Poribacteria bacterium]|nr:DUF2188 domain-containing protein [Candidatus Poribacteria bacterium]